MPGKVLETYLIKNNIKQHFGVSTGALYVGHCHPSFPRLTSVHPWTLTRWGNAAECPEKLGPRVRWLQEVMAIRKVLFSTVTISTQASFNDCLAIKNAFKL